MSFLDPIKRRTPPRGAAVERDPAASVAAEPAPPSELELAHARRRRTRFWVWTSVIATPILVVVTYVGMLWSWTGDYLEDPRSPDSGLVLWMAPTPQHGYAYARRPLYPNPWPGSPKAPGRSYFMATPGGARLLDYAEPRIDPLLKALADGGRQVRNLGDDVVAIEPEDDPGTLWLGIETKMERYPLGALDEFRIRFGKRDLDGAREEAMRLVERFPGRTTPKYWAIALSIHLGQFKDAERLLARWEDRFLEPGAYRGSAYLRWLRADLALAATEDSVERARWFEVFPSDPFWVWRKPPDPTLKYLPFEQFLARIDELADIDPPARRSIESVEATQTTTRWSAVAILNARALLLAIAGRQEEARRLLYGAIVACRNYDVSPSEHHAALAIYFEGRVLKFLEELILRSNRDPDGWGSLWSEFERQAVRRMPLDARRIIRPFDEEALISLSEAFDVLLALPKGSHASLATPAGCVASAYDLETRWNLFRESIRAKHFRAANGRWPTIGPDGALEELTLEPKAGPIVDPFESPPRSLRAMTDGDDLVLYSIGLDRRDEGAAFECDIRQSVYGGDILLRLRPGFDYDFPEDPGHEYWGFAEVFRRYPNGLPPDPNYSRIRRIGLSYSPANETELLAWSVGPYSFTNEPHQPPDYVAKESPVISYDPTNGLQSKGEIMMPLRFKPMPDDPPVPGAPRPNPPSADGNPFGEAIGALAPPAPAGPNPFADARADAPARSTSDHERGAASETAAASP